ncbi:hypothetical protein KKA04_01035, partial [Patescibacteria group bacterium]|nr:hypothetical protein [Patescibacteria group bacterium]
MDKNKNQHIRIGKYFRILFTIAILLCAATPAHARLLFSQDYLDEVYRLDTDKIMTVNNIAGLEFESQTTGNVLVDLQNTGDFIFQDAGTPFATFDDSGNVTFENQFDANGNTTLGNALTDTLTIGATVLGGSPLVFEGATADGFETTFGINDPTAARNIAFPDASGTVAVSATSPVTLSATGDIGLDQTANFTWTGIHDYSGATYSGGSPFV